VSEWDDQCIRSKVGAGIVVTCRKGEPPKVLEKLKDDEVGA